MTDTPDTSPEAVERLADHLDGPVRIAAQDLIDAYFGRLRKCLASIPADKSKDADLVCVTGITKAAATLRALAAKLQAAEAALEVPEVPEVKALVEAANVSVDRLEYSADTFYDQGCLTREDACRAVANKLRAALAALEKTREG